MERAFDVIGLAREVLIYRGLVIMPKRRFHLVMNEAEYAAFKDKIDLVSCRDLSKIVSFETELPKSQESEPVIAEDLKGVENELQDDIGHKKERTKTKTKREI